MWENITVWINDLANTEIHFWMHFVQRGNAPFSDNITETQSRPLVMFGMDGVAWQ
jgi:hypothetical protein